ncbi:MAG: DsbA family protein [Pseudomonadota bacterium]
MSFRSAFLASSFLLAACGASAPGESQAQDSALTDAEFDKRLQEALMRNPEFILEAVEAYRQKMESEAGVATREAIANVFTELKSAQSGHAIGARAEDADVIVIEFFDYHCGFCKRAVDDVLSLASDNQSVRIVFQELPILREESRDAAIIALAAGQISNETYKSVHRQFMQTSGIIDEQRLNGIISKAGVSPGEINKAKKDNADTIEKRLNRSVEIARQIGITGTPAFIVSKADGSDFRLIEGYQPEVLSQAVETMLGS